MRCLDHEREAEVRSMLREAGRLPVSPFVSAVALSLHTAIYRHRQASVTELAERARDVERNVESLIVRAQDDALARHVVEAKRSLEIGELQQAEDDEGGLAMRLAEGASC